MSRSSLDSIRSSVSASISRNSDKISFVVNTFWKQKIPPADAGGLELRDDSVVSLGVTLAETTRSSAGFVVFRNREGASEEVARS